VSFIWHATINLFGWTKWQINLSRVTNTVELLHTTYIHTYILVHKQMYWIWMNLQRFQASNGKSYIRNIFTLPYKEICWQKLYRIAGKFGREKVWWIWRITKLKSSKFLLTIIIFWLNLFIHQTFFHQMLKTSKFAKLSPSQTFPLYGICLVLVLYMCTLEQLKRTT